MNSNPTTVVQRAGAFARALTPGTSLLTRRTADGLEHYLITQSNRGKDDSVMLALAHTVGAHGTLVEDPEPLFEAAAIRRMSVKGDGVGGRSTQAGIDPSEAARIIASTLRPGDWVAVSLRPFRRFEAKRVRTWLRDTSGTSVAPTHHSIQADAIVMSIYAGSSSPRDADATARQIVSAMPGFDVNTKPTRVPGLSGLQGGVVGLLAAAAVAGIAGPHAIHAPDWFTPALSGGGLGGLAAFIGATFTGLIHTPRIQLARGLAMNRLPAPSARIKPPAASRRETRRDDGSFIPAKPGGYPLASTSFATGPQLPVGIVAPHGSAASGPAQTGIRAVPPAVTQRIGPFVGDANGGPVFLSAVDAWQGLMALGEPGSGKSRLIHALFGWSLLDRQTPAGVPGWPGRNSAMVVFESKGAHAAQSYLDYGKKARTDVAYVDLSDPRTLAIDLFDTPGSVETRSRAIVAALKYSFSDGSIMEKSFDTLTQVIAGGLATTDQVVRIANLKEGTSIHTGKSPFYYAAHLLGVFGDTSGVALYGAIQQENIRFVEAGMPNGDLSFAAERLGQLYGSGRSVAQRSSMTEAPRNKVSAMLTAEAWWSRPSRITWSQILQNHGVVVVNTGNALDGSGFDDELVSQMSSMLMHTLYSSIKRNCSDWWDTGRSVSIFSDELMLLAGSSEEVITWLRDQGRDYGVRPFFATQRPGQLSKGVRTSVLGFGTVVAFKQNDPETINDIVKRLAISGQAWTGADLLNLPKFEAVVQTVVNQTSVAPFTVHLHDFERDAVQFHDRQGYVGAPLVDGTIS